MTLVLPTAEQSLTYPAQAVTDATDLGALASAGQQTGVVSGCTVAALSTPGMAVSVAAGTVLAAGVSVPVAAVSSLTIATAPSTGDRRDIVVSSSAGVVSVVEGTANSATGWTGTSTFLPAVKPAVPSGSVLLGEVYVAQGVTSIAAGAVVDKTALMEVGGAIPAGGFVQAPPSISVGFQSLTLTPGQLQAVAAYVPLGSPSLKTLEAGYDAEGGSTIYLGVYSDTDGYPGALLASTSTSTPAYNTATGTLNAAVSGPWPAVLWFVSLLPSGGTAPSGASVFYGEVLPTPSTQQGANNTFTNAVACVYSAVSTYSALPSSFPTGGRKQVASGTGSTALVITGGF